MIEWDDGLVAALARRRCVIVIGSGVSANSVAEDGSRPRTWGAFLEYLYKGLGKQVNHISRSLKEVRYLEACSYLKKELGAAWKTKIEDEYKKAYKAAKIHEHIFDLDSRIVASLNFDKIYDTYAIKASDGTVTVKNYDNAELRSAIDGSNRCVIKLHGSIDTTTTLIFTLEDYARARTKHADFYEVLTSLLHTHTFLFLGCGLSDPDLQILFEDYHHKYDVAPHFMTAPSPVSDAQIELVRDTRGINIFKYSANDGHAALTNSLGELVKKVNAKRDLIAETRDW